MATTLKLLDQVRETSLHTVLLSGRCRPSPSRGRCRHRAPQHRGSFLGPEIATPEYVKDLGDFSISSFRSMSSPSRPSNLGWNPKGISPLAKQQVFHLECRETATMLVAVRT